MPDNDQTKSTERPRHEVWVIVLFAIVFLIILGAVGYYFWADSGSPQQIPQTPFPSPTSTQSENSTSTPPIDQTTTSTGDRVDFRLGDTIRIFAGDQIGIASPGNDNYPRYLLTANNFSDSRCPPGVQCIWQGERGVSLTLVLNGTEATPKTFELKQITAPTGTAYGVKLTLIAIEDDKGGTYADIKVE